jgi:aryl-alcohol dehydrogenase-like predicted oxidoreductase
MEHRPLGRTGVSVSKLCLGAMMFGDWGTKDHDQSIRIIHRALDAGINFIDTADVYSQGESEVIVGKALAGGRRDDVVLATKVWSAMGEDANRRGASRRWIIREVEESLARLGTDWIDLYQVHRYEPDIDIDIEETLGALSDLVQQGKVRYIGSSTWPASAIVAAQWAARDRHLQRFVCEQPPYSILVRGIEAEVLPACARYGMGVISYSPLAQGWLSGRYRRDADQAAPFSAARWRLAERFDLSLPANQRKLEAAEALAQLAEEAGMSLIELAIALCSTIRRSPRRSSGPAPWSSSKASSPPPTSPWTRRCWAASTRSSHPAPTSTPPTAAGSTRPCSQRRDGDRGGCAGGWPAIDPLTKETRP